MIVAAPTIAEAWDDLYYLERAAQVQLLAMATQRELKPGPTPLRSALVSRCARAIHRVRGRICTVRCGAWPFTTD